MINQMYFHYVDDKSVSSFIRSHSYQFQNNLKIYYNYSRVVCLADFFNVLEGLGLGSAAKVAVVSGSSSDPELKLLKYESLDIIDYEASTNSYDLDSDWSSGKNLKVAEGGGANFVLCSQVLEHIYSPLQGLTNLKYITRPGGYIWLSIPTINCIHGEPYFYSAGYHPRFLSRLGKEAGLECVHIGMWGSRKYLVSAVLGRWLTHNQLKPGFHSKFDLAFPWLALQDGRYNDLSGHFITDCWALYRRPESD